MTVDSILRGFTKPLKQLDKLAAKLDRQIKNDTERIASLQETVDGRASEAEKARAVITNLSAFLDRLADPVTPKSD